jgi:integrase
VSTKPGVFQPVRPLGRSSIDNYCKPLQGILKLALRRRLISANPFSALTTLDRPSNDKQREEREWATEDVESLLQASAAHAAMPTSNYDYTPLLRLTARLGLRLGEATGLQWRDFNPVEGTLRIERQWTRFGAYGPTKTEAGKRTLYLTADLVENLKLLKELSEFVGDDSPVFASRNATPLTPRNVTRRGFEAARDHAGLDAGFTMHSLRHHAISRLLSAGIDLELVASIAGHEDSRTTSRVYAHVIDRAKKASAVREALSA